MENATEMMGLLLSDQTGGQAWFVNGIRHRVDGPAYITLGEQVWYNTGKLHRTDGPAVTKRMVIKNGG